MFKWNTHREGQMLCEDARIMLMIHVTTDLGGLSGKPEVNFEKRSVGSAICLGCVGNRA